MVLSDLICTLQYQILKQSMNIPTVHQNNEDLRNSVAVTALEVETYRYYEKSEKNNHWTGTFAHMNGIIGSR
ncbi:hypothetical protein FWK35_00016399 [Aphis craccivora]|uniref:Uncharacterized protein n=1 Tax=Aphis craccivora TaxID=307492 RepID=A0A6G0Z865_APHCR|nr:hypothetical protein FWK35_00016399 [Aphis craccivora]